MRYFRRFSPSPVLEGFVKHFWAGYSDALPPDRSVQRILPDGCVELIFSAGDPMDSVVNSRDESSGRSFIAGQITQVLQLQARGRVDMFGVTLYPDAAYPLLGHALDEFTERSVDLRFAWGGAAREIEERILNARDTDEKIGIIERALLDRLSSSDRDKDRVIAASVAAIERFCGMLSIERLAQDVNLSRRQLEKKFRHQVGLSPKRYARIMRFRHVLDLVKRDGIYDWATLVATCNYHDQSHLIKDFRTFTGLSPSAYFAEKAPTAALAAS